jgi:transposase
MPTASRYPTDLTDAEWNILKPLVPKPKPGGRPIKYPRRDILNALLYHKQAGGAWRLLPHDLPPWGTVYHYFRLWTRDGTWDRIQHRLRDQLRQQRGKQKAPSAAILDRQTVKVGEQGGPSGYDAGKKIKGRKRHVLVDSLGLLLGVWVTAADVQDRDGAKRLSEATHEAFDGIVAALEAMFLDQILINALGGQSRLQSDMNPRDKRLAETLSARARARGRNGRFWRNRIPPTRRTEWLVLKLAAGSIRRWWRDPHRFSGDASIRPASLVQYRNGLLQAHFELVHRLQRFV